MTQRIMGCILMPLLGNKLCQESFALNCMCDGDKVGCFTCLKLVKDKFKLGPTYQRRDLT